MGDLHTDVVALRQTVRGGGQDGVGVDVGSVDVFPAVPLDVEFHEGDQPKRHPAALGGFDRDVDRRLSSDALAHARVRRVTASVRR